MANEESNRPRQAVGAVRKRQPFVHTVLPLTVSLSGLLQQIARENGGTYRHVRQDELP